MKSIIRKTLAAAAALSSAMTPMASQFTAASAARLGTVAAMGSIAAMAPSAAYAQSGKRMCGTVWDGLRPGGSRQGLVSVGMEVSKYDFVTCPALIVGWIALTSLPRGVQGFAQSVFNNSAGVGTGLIGNIRLNETCESFSRRVQANTGDVCLRMTDYKLYAFVKIYGGIFSMGRV